MKEPLVSIVTPLYNSEKYVAETIESVLAQSYSNWEMLIVDDCSTDNGAEIVKEYQKKDNRIKYIKLETNSGAAIARNKAISVAKGKYVAFLDSDDLWSDNKLVKQIYFMENSNYYFSFTNYEIFDCQDVRRVIKSPIKVSFKSMLKSCRIGCLTVIYNQEKIGEIKIPNLKKRNDYAIWLKVLKKTDGYLYDEVLARYRIHSDGLSSGSKIKLIRYHYIMFRRSEGYGMLKSLFCSIRNAWYYLIGRR